ncbi:MFS transporter, partial [Streptomyces sp. t39]|uniref:MFS transporter n=1 Tax=Streptomyces sp. t39 TaxID=1828156 RepID=UPI0016500FBD
MDAVTATMRGPGPTVPTAGGRQAWETTWLLLVFMLVNFADKAVLGLAGPEIMKEFGLTRQEFGTAQAAFFGLFSLSALGVSFLTRKVRTSVLLLVMGLLWAAAQLPMLWGAAGFATLIATRVLLGFAEGPSAPVAVHHVHGWFEQREPGRPERPAPAEVGDHRARRGHQEQTGAGTGRQPSDPSAQDCPAGQQPVSQQDHAVGHGSPADRGGGPVEVPADHRPEIVRQPGEFGAHHPIGGERTQC